MGERVGLILNLLPFRTHAQPTDHAWVVPWLGKASARRTSGICLGLLTLYHTPISHKTQSTRRVHNTFLALDEDMNGMLARSEFSQISNGTMSPLFIQVGCAG